MDRNRLALEFVDKLIRFSLGCEVAPIPSSVAFPCRPEMALTTTATSRMIRVDLRHPGAAHRP
jgi:hypothetical protein